MINYKLTVQEMADLFRTGADVLEREKWAKGDYSQNDNDDKMVFPWESGATCFCALGAIAKASGDDSYYKMSDCEHMYRELAEDHSDLHLQGLDFYNDGVAESKEQVVEHMRHVADILEGKVAQ